MLRPATLRDIAAARVQDAQVLCNNSRPDGAGYICGYAVELTLKARICDTLNWSGYPETSKEFQDLQSFKTHNLDVLLRLSGRENSIKQDPGHFADWSIIRDNWSPEMRYRAIGTISATEALTFLGSTRALLALL